MRGSWFRFQGAGFRARGSGFGVEGAPCAGTVCDAGPSTPRRVSPGEPPKEEDEVAFLGVVGVSLKVKDDEVLGRALKEDDVALPRLYRGASPIRKRPPP